MNDTSSLLLLVAVLAAILMVQHLLNRLLYGAPEKDARERIAISPNGEVVIETRRGESHSFHRNEVRAVRGRDLIDGITEVVIDLFERRIVVDVSSKAVQQEMVGRLAR